MVSVELEHSWEVRDSEKSDINVESNTDDQSSPSTDNADNIEFNLVSETTEYCVRSGLIIYAMCKTPGCECPTAGEHNVPMDEGSDASENENEQLNSDDSYFSETSSDEGASDSDADSASGNRVTTDMVVWVMLKEKGLITEEKYAEKPVECEEDIKHLIPKLPRRASSESSDDNETQNNGVSLLDQFFELISKETEKKCAESPNGNVECQRKEETVNDEKNDTGVCDLPKENTNISGDNAATERSSDEVISTSKLQQELAVVENNGNKSMEKVIQLMPQQETIHDTNKNDSNQEEQHESEASADETANKEWNRAYGLARVECIKKLSTIRETMPETLKQGKDCGTTKEDIKDILNENNIKPEEINIETTNDKGQDAGLTKTKEDSKSVDQKSENKSNQATNKKSNSFKYILKHIVKEKLISEDYEYVDVLETYVKDLDEHYKNNKAVDIFDKPNRDLKQFALFLNFYSPSSYKYIVETFNTPLPEHKILCTWYLNDRDKPGLTERAFKILKQKASGKRLTCALMSRDIFMRNYGLDYDQVDYGGGCNFEYTDKAVMTFVFVLVSLDEDWKIPIGYIFAKHIPAETQAELIRVCLTQCHEAGADVVAVTLETPTPAEFLGCSFQDPKNLKTIFKHPACDRDVAVWIDPCLALRSARHTLKVKGVLQDDQGNKIGWNLIRKLRNLYSDESIELEPAKFLQLRNHVAKVGLTSEIFSDGLSPALELCEALIPESFRDTAATRRYIEVVNTLYDILHSRITKNMDEVTQDMNMAKEYILSLFCNEENALSPLDTENLAADKRLKFRSFLDGKPACGFIGFLICIESFKHLYATLVEKEHRMNHLNPHRLCKDHAEYFVRNLRAYDGLPSEDFNSWAYQCYYDHLFDILEKNPNFSDKNVKLEHWDMKSKYTPAVTINFTSGKRAYDEVYSLQCGPKKLPKTSHDDRATKIVRAYSKAMDTEADLSTRKNMVGYLAGWIAAKFAKCLKCEACIDALCTDKKLWFHKFITSKDIKGVCLPSEELFRICWECERALRLKRTPASLRAWVLRRLLPKFPWSSRVAKHPPGHHTHLARAVIAKYIPLRTAAPFSTKDKKKIADMFNMFSCFAQAGLFDKQLESEED